MLQPFLLLKQTLEAEVDYGALRLDGPHVFFSSAGDLLSRKAAINTTASISLTVRLNNASRVDWKFTSKEGDGFSLEEMVYVDGRNKRILKPNLKEKQIELLADPLLIEIKKEKGREDVRWGISQNKCFLDIILKRNGIHVGALPPSRAIAQEFITHMIHVPGLRGKPEREFRRTAVKKFFRGPFEPYVAAIILNWEETKDNRLELLVRYLEGLGLTAMVKSTVLDDTRVQLSVGRLPPNSRKSSKDLVNIADVGFGVSQCLPAIVALLVAEPENTVYLEQPETHLHPRAQVALASILAETAQRGVTVIAETHSSLLLRGIQTLVAEGKLSPDLVKLHWFSRDKKDGATKVTSADLDERGAFGDWPMDFDDVELEAEKDYLDAVGKRMFG
jgi:hypothetical protein